MQQKVAKSGHWIRLLQGGVEFFPALIEALDQSSSEILIETFIFHFESAGAEVAGALERASQRGVSVYLMMDGIGTPGVPAAWQHRWDTAGVKWHRFSALGFTGLLNPVRWKRLHRKLCVVDQTLAFCGGINMVDDLLEPGLPALEAPRYDFALQIQGPLVADMRLAMIDLWRKLQIKQKLGQLKFRAAGEVWLQGKGASLRRGTAQAEAPFAVPRSKNTGAPENPANGYFDVSAALVLRDNLRNRSKIEKAYRQAMGSAKKDIVIANAYFLPGRRLRSALYHARTRGVRVQLLLQGRYDNFMQFHGSRPIIADMLAKGIEIYEYRASLLHAKVSVIDGEWATVGSSNLDPLSLLLAREANVVMSHSALAAQLQACLLSAMQTNAMELDNKRFLQRSFWDRFLDRVAFAGMRTLLFLTGFRY